MTTFFTKARYIFGFIFFIVCWFDMKTAGAVSADKPIILTSSNADKTQANSALTTLVDEILDYVMMFGVAGIAIGLVLCVPFIGNKETGMKGIKGSVVVILVAAFFDFAVLGLLNKLF